MHFILSDWQNLPPASRRRPRPARRPSNISAPPISPSTAAFPRAKRYSQHTYLTTERRGGRPDTCRSARRTTERHNPSTMGADRKRPRHRVWSATCSSEHTNLATGRHGGRPPADSLPSGNASVRNGVGGRSALYSRWRRQVPRLSC